MKKYLLVVIIVIGGMMTQLQAQNYTTVVGVRAGLPGGLTAKTLLNGGMFGLEGIIGADFEKNFNLVGLFTYQGYINRSLNWYAGGGVTFMTNRNYYNVGIDAVGGVELTFDNYPVNVAMDLKPRFRVADRKFAWYEMGLSVRYILQ